MGEPRASTAATFQRDGTAAAKSEAYLYTWKMKALKLEIGIIYVTLRLRCSIGSGFVVVLMKTEDESEATEDEELVFIQIRFCILTMQSCKVQSDAPDFQHWLHTGAVANQPEILEDNSPLLKRFCFALLTH